MPGAPRRHAGSTLAGLLVTSLVITAVPPGRAVAAGQPAAAARYEAENATVARGTTDSNWPGFTGTGFVNYDNVADSYVEFTVESPAAQAATLAFRFANG